MEIKNDFEPETSERFQIVLSVISGDVVLANPNVATVIINANDKTHGILSLKTTQGITDPVYHINEDEDSEYSGIIIIRNGGAFGNVSVAWSLHRNDSESEPLANGITPASGVVRFSEGQKEQAVTLNIVQDQIPEVQISFSQRKTNRGCFFQPERDFLPNLGTSNSIDLVLFCSGQLRNISHSQKWRLDDAELFFCLHYTGRRPFSVPFIGGHSDRWCDGRGDSGRRRCHRGQRRCVRCRKPRLSQT